MNNNFKLLLVAAAAFCIGLTAANTAVSDVPSNYKVAIVDVPKVFTASQQLKNLKDEQKKKGEELAKFIENAKSSIDKETDAVKKKALEEKYTKEFQTKRATISKDYETKWLAVEKNISSIIDEKAKADGYNLVLAKGVVLSGGTDITEDVAKKVK